MSFITKIEAKIEEEIFQEKRKQDPLYTRNAFKKYKKYPEYQNTFNKKRKAILSEMNNTKENQKKIKLLNEFYNENVNMDAVINVIENILKTSRLYYMPANNLVRLKADNLNDYRNLIVNGMFLTVTYCKYQDSILSLMSILYKKMNLPEIPFSELGYKPDEYVIDGNYEPVHMNEYVPVPSDDFIHNVNVYFTHEKVFQLIFKNERYLQMKKTYQLDSLMLKEIPEDYTQLYPQARLLNRHFILHIGDTNTGKTYEALQELKAAESGTYLAPLRLLALEIQERLNDEGTPCSMTTGEEEDIIPEAKHMSSTVEKLDMNKYYDVCVIDEAQMIEDNDRGWAWTNAILGAYSERIHVCMSENAKNIVIKLIEMCKDDYEIVEHKRNTPLQFQDKQFRFDTDIQEHDALIVFSRKKVLSVATELEHMGIHCSVIYGALPYSVRKNEIRKFVEGETKVVVSTDAIGMGMNLPIKRIVFLESSKFDGTEVRFLKVPEVKQIAGRAGRQGMFNTGYVASMVDVKYIKEILNEVYVPIEHAKIQLPKSLLSLDMPLSDIMENWIRIPDNGCFQKSSLEYDLKLCKILEKTIVLPKETMLDLINIPFDENMQELEDLWLSLTLCHFNGDDILDFMEIPEPDEKTPLETLELMYKQLDLYFSFAKAVHYNRENFLPNIAKLKEEISIFIMEKLKTKEVYRTCRICGRKMKWNEQYSICEKCYKNKRNYYRW